MKDSILIFYEKLMRKVEPMNHLKYFRSQIFILFTFLLLIQGISGSASPRLWLEKTKNQFYLIENTHKLLINLRSEAPEKISLPGNYKIQIKTIPGLKPYSVIVITRNGRQIGSADLNIIRDQWLKDDALWRS